ncbi:MAG: tetratricopeptide repeat protein [Actinobacteria bacterium]|nr:MAG: tetratricopeptide repeat protein [Actinomycetota bacterium]
MTVVDVSEQDFQREVIERSTALPVVVDFWAAWCGPCKALGPLLEAEAERREGKVVLAKVDTDANPGLSQSFGIQGIPAVKAFSGGKVVDEFVGAQPPPAVQRFFDRLVPSRADELAAAGDEASLREALSLEPGRADAAVALARLLRDRDEREEALAVLEPVTGSFQADGLAARLRLEQAAHAEEASSATAGDGAAAESGLAGQLAAGLSALDRGETERGVELLLEALAQPGAPREELRQVIVGALEELGVEHPAARDARRRLAAALY